MRLISNFPATQFKETMRKDFTNYIINCTKSVIFWTRVSSIAGAFMLFFLFVFFIFKKPLSLTAMVVLAIAWFFLSILQELRWKYFCEQIETLLECANITN